jgi:hypothetical protein
VCPQQKTRSTSVDEMTCPPKTDPGIMVDPRWRIDAKKSVYAGTNRERFAGSRGRREDYGADPSAWHYGDHVPPLAEEIRGMQGSDAKRLRGLEEENRQLKRLVADQALNLLVVKDLLGKPW